jgi:hypothetical protein
MSVHLNLIQMCNPFELKFSHSTIYPSKKMKFFLILSRTPLSLALISTALALSLQGCGGGAGGDTTASNIPPVITPPITGGSTGGGSGGTGGSPPAPGNAAPTDAQAYETALKLWRNDNLQVHPKGSCAGCHGADFFDLARIGSTDTDMIRRATLDGASTEQAQALVQAVKKMRLDLKLPADTNARQFRPFQPGGAILLPDLTDDVLTANIKRDVAFGEQLKTFLPTLFGERIDTLAKAKQAEKELLDLAAGSNAGGANAQRMNLRNLPTGVQYPLWSADFHHGSKEGTFNDWIADIAHDAKPERRIEWLALQDAYLQNPSNDNFWRMYSAAREMTQLPLLGDCTLANTIVNTGLKCEATDDFNKHKFLSAMKGQHMLRLQARGELDTFLRGPIAFSYLDSSTQTVSKLPFLPSDMWEIGDRGRVMLESTQEAATFKGNLAALGFPKFAQDSIDPLRSAGTEQAALRKAWFWIGFTLDPSFSRISKSNATLSGEYMVGTLVEERMFNHMHFSALMRLVTKANLQEANMRKLNNIATVQPDAVRFMANYSYATGYNRTVPARLWNESNNPVVKFPTDLKAQSEAIFAKLVGNGFRMSLLLQTDALDTNKLSADDNVQLIKIMSNSINSTNGGTIYGLAATMHDHFKNLHANTQLADEAMVKALLSKLGITASQGF